jgi:hypothetical protein
MVPEADKVTWVRVMDHVFQDYSDGLRVKFESALTLLTLDERHAMVVNIEERQLRSA